MTKQIPLKNSKISDTFWTPFMERIRMNVIPYQWEALNDRIEGAAPSYCMRNFKIAAELTHPDIDYGVDTSLGHGGCVFQDSDAAKWIEAAAYTLIWRPDPELEKTVEGAIAIICNAQQQDGYLNTYYTINGPEKRFTNIRDNHELYCFGHFLEAAIAWYEASGKRTLLDALIRYTDCINRHFGPEEGKLHGYPGHEIAEMALVRLFEVTKNESYLKLAQYFINQRGKDPFFFEEEARHNGNGPAWKGSYFGPQYWQAGKPVREQQTPEGHAVRAVYLYSGMADIARLTGDESLLQTCAGLWNSIVNRQMYITGSIGQSAYGESFTFDYDLPNDTVYGETCAAIGLVFFAKRMALIRPKGTYGDVMEKALYNGIISGMSLDGKSFFYVNPLEVNPESCIKDQACRHVKTERQKWFGCACCPPNLARIIASLGNYIHTVNDSEIYTHLYIAGETAINIGGKNLILGIETVYPWEPAVTISFAPERPVYFTYAFRIPGWCENFSVKLNNGGVNFITKDGFALVEREWQNGDSLEIVFDMPVQIVYTNPHVRENSGKAALMRGPLVYCLEEADNGKELFRIHLGQPEKFQVRIAPDLPGEVIAISCAGKKEKNWDTDILYANSHEGSGSMFEEISLRWIPYYAWANRAVGEMTVWVKR